MKQTIAVAFLAAMVLIPSPSVKADPIPVSWQKISELRYIGYGRQRFLIPLAPVRPDYVDLRTAAPCALQIYPAFIDQSRRASISGQLLSVTRNATGATDGIYALGYPGNGALGAIQVDLESSYYYGPEAACRVEAFLGWRSSAPPVDETQPSGGSGSGEVGSGGNTGTGSGGLGEPVTGGDSTVPPLPTP